MRFLLFLAAFFMTSGTANVGRVDLNLMENELAFTFFNLSDGEATLIQDAGHNVLINTGNKSAREELFQRLKVYGVTDLDKLILTNSSAVYTGNVEAVIKKYHVRTVISSKAILEQLDRNFNLPHTDIWKPGKTAEILQGLQSVVLFEKQPDEIDGEASLTVRFQFGTEKVLYMGTADPEMEKQLAGNPLVDCDILKVGDFALDREMNTRFLEKVNPQVAILFHRKGRLPGKKTLEKLDTVWIDVYRTHQIGTISIKFNSHSYQVIPIPIEKEDALDFTRLY
ncbi:MAG TPA: hypothetical protein VFK33_00900 [Bacillales bacterium]|nr:hypothetical protein [Bacillales bacterium]